MDALRIVTKDWKIVNINSFLFITMMNGGEDEKGRPLFALVGILNLDYDHTTLYTSLTPQKVLLAFNEVYRALDSRKPVVDLRENEEEEPDMKTIMILPNKSQNPGKENLN